DVALDRGPEAHDRDEPDEEHPVAHVGEDAELVGPHGSREDDIEREADEAREHADGERGGCAAQKHAHRAVTGDVPVQRMIRDHLPHAFRSDHKSSRPRLLSTAATCYARLRATSSLCIDAIWSSTEDG